MRPTGFTLIELVIVVALVGVLILLASIQMERWRDADAVRTAARTVQGAFAHARSEAIRTGNIHLLFLQTDIGGATLTDQDGDPVPILVLDDGRPGSAGQNCTIDPGETTQVFRLARGVGIGATSATAKVPTDEGAAGSFADGASFEDGIGGNANWVLFRPDGTPRAATTACAQGALGTGGGGIYLSNAERDVAIVLSPLGASRVYAWNQELATWN